MPCATRWVSVCAQCTHATRFGSGALHAAARGDAHGSPEVQSGTRPVNESRTHKRMIGAPGNAEPQLGRAARMCTSGWHSDGGRGCWHHRPRGLKPSADLQSLAGCYLCRVAAARAREGLAYQQRMHAPGFTPGAQRLAVRSDARGGEETQRVTSLGAPSPSSAGLACQRMGNEYTNGRRTWEGSGA